MANFHVTPDGPRKCQDRHGLCPYAKEGKPHFDNYSEALVHYDKVMSESFGVMPTPTVVEKARRKVYQSQEDLSRFTRKVRSEAKIRAAMAVITVQRRAKKISDGQVVARARTMRDAFAARSEVLEARWEQRIAERAAVRAAATARIADRAESRGNVGPEGNYQAMLDRIARLEDEVARMRAGASTGDRASTSDGPIVPVPYTAAESASSRNPVVVNRVASVSDRLAGAVAAANVSGVTTGYRLSNQTLDRLRKSPGRQNVVSEIEKRRAVADAFNAALQGGPTEEEVAAMRASYVRKTAGAAGDSAGKPGDRLWSKGVDEVLPSKAEARTLNQRLKKESRARALREAQERRADRREVLRNSLSRAGKVTPGRKSNQGKSSRVNSLLDRLR